MLQVISTLFSYYPLSHVFEIEVHTLAGSTRGYEDGKGTDVKFNNPAGIVLNPIDDCLYVCDYNNSMIRKVTKSGLIHHD